MSGPGPISDDESSEWEAEIGLPQFEDPFIQKYFSGREALIEREKSQRSDDFFRNSLSPLATEACNIVSRIIADEHATIWTGQLQQDAAQKEHVDVYPGMPFHLARATMEKTKSWSIVKMMPKGALLHAHMDATMNVTFLIQQALDTDGMAMSATKPLIDMTSHKDCELLFRFKKSVASPAASIWTEKYEPTQFVSMRQAADAYPKGGRVGFIAWLTEFCSIPPEESLKHYRGLDAIWQKFGSCFPPLNSLLNYEPIFRASIQRLLSDLVLDGISWVDFRALFVTEFFLENNETPCTDCTDFLRIWSEEVQIFQQTELGQKFWGCRFIWTCLRSLNRKQLIENMQSCIEMKVKFPDLICGFDCVGYENAGRSLADMVPELFWFKKHCSEMGVDIPFLFHAGECLGDGDEADQNLYDAILLGSRRIGHAFSLYRHPLLTEMVKTKRILVEGCPISNELLRLTMSIKAHPLPALLSKGVPCCLANDDPGVLGYGTSGVTHDFWQALQGWENLGLEGLGSLAENSVRWACYSDQSTKEWNKDVADGKYGQGIRAERMQAWTRAWDKFCEWVVSEYGIEYGGNL